MGLGTAIEWVDATLSTVYGCTQVSPACTNCYIPRQTPLRRYGMKFEYKGKEQGVTTGLYFAKEHLKWPWEKKWLAKVDELGRPLRVFVNDMSDTFHPDVPDEHLDKLFAMFAQADHCQFLVLTKRPERALDYMTTGRSAQLGFMHRPLPNVWMGVTVENQTMADKRLPILGQIPAAVRFVSNEPALGPVDWAPWLKVPKYDTADCPTCEGSGSVAPWMGDGVYRDGGAQCPDCAPDLSSGNRAFDWLITGGESGPGARPQVLGYLKDAVRVGDRAAVPVFVKQLGSHPTNREGEPHPVKHSKGGDPAEWPEELQVREFPA